MNSVLKIIFQRLALGLLTLVIVSFVIFAAVNALPGDFAAAILGQGATEEAKAAIRADIGLNEPFFVRYFTWLGGIATGDLGVSYSQLMFANNMGGDQLIPITEQIRPRFVNTMFLAGLTAVIAVPLSLTIGILAALYRGSVFDRVANIFTLSSISSPEFFLAYVLILIVTVFQLQDFFKVIALPNSDMGFFERVQITLMPALTLTLVITAHMMRMTRAAIINLLASPYIEMARLKGMNPMRVIVVHALPNALAPIINVIALNLAYLITGVVVVEVVFTYPGIGNLFVDAVRNRDIPVVQVCCLIFAAAYILLNLTADILSILSNPRLRHPR